MNIAPTFWLLVMLTIILWYAVVTILVAVKGFDNIKDLIARQKRRE